MSANTTIHEAISRAFASRRARLAATQLGGNGMLGVCVFHRPILACVHGFNCTLAQSATHDDEPAETTAWRFAEARRRIERD